MEEDQELPFECDFCDRRFNNSGNLAMHNKYIHKCSNWTCNICNHVFRRSADLDRHKDAIHSELEKVKCDLCGIFVKPLSLRAHKQNLHYSNAVNCTFCENQFSNKRSLYTHIKRVHGETPEVMESCDLCEKNFATKERLKEHMVKGHSQKQNCPFCAIEVKHLKIHLKTVHGDIPKLTCDVCHCTLKGSKALEKHKRDQHSEESQVLIDCNICGKTLLSRTYTRHLKRQHSDNSIVKCDLCFKEFPRQANLNVHIRTIHSGIEKKKMKCEKCEESFLTKTGLKFHIARVHDQKRYPCDLCDRTFTSEYHMKDHRNNKHFGMESRTKCEICSKTFCNPSTFRQHLKIVHQGLKNRIYF